MSNYNFKVLRRCWFSVFLAFFSAHAADLDLTDAHLTVPATLSKQETKAIEMLRDEVEKRTLIRFPLGAGDHGPVVAISRGHGAAEGYSLKTSVAQVSLAAGLH